MENGSVNSLRGVLVGEKYIITLPRQGAVFVRENKLLTLYIFYILLLGNIQDCGYCKCVRFVV